MNGVDYISSKQISEIFKILGHPLRVSIVSNLRNRSMNYTTLQKKLGNPSTGTLNFHIKKMDPLLEKDGDKYSLNQLGRKAIELIDQYTEDSELREDKQVLQEDVEYWNEFLELVPHFAPGIMIVGMILLNIVLRISSEFGSTFQLKNLILFIGLVPIVRWMWQKIYLSSRPPSTLIFMFLNYLIGYTFLVLYQLFSIPHNFDILGDVYRIKNAQESIPGTLLPSIRDILIQSEIRRSNIELDIYFLIFTLVPIVALGWAYYTFNELPSLTSRIRQVDEVTVSSKITPNNYNISFMFLIIVLSDLILLALITGLVRGMGVENQLYFLLSPLQLLVFSLLFMVKFGIMLYFSTNEYGIKGYSKGNRIVYLLIILIVIEIMVMFYLYHEIERNYISVTDAHFLYIDTSLIENIIIYLNMAFGLSVYAYDRWETNLSIQFNNKKSIIVFSLFITWRTITHVQRHSILMINSNNIFQVLLFILPALILISVGTLSKLVNSPRKKKLILLFPYVAFLLVVSFIEIFGSGRFELNKIWISILMSIIVTMIGYYGSKLFSDYP